MIKSYRLAWRSLFDSVHKCMQKIYNILIFQTFMISFFGPKIYTKGFLGCHNNDTLSLTLWLPFNHGICLWCVPLASQLAYFGIHYNDVIMGTMASQITSLTIAYSTVYSGADQRKHQSSVSLPFVRGIHRWPVNSPHKWPVTRKRFPFDDVIMTCFSICLRCQYFRTIQGRLSMNASVTYNMGLRFRGVNV